MNKLFRYEFKRLLRERNFVVVLSILLLIGIGGAVYSIAEYLPVEQAWKFLPVDKNGNFLSNQSISTYSFFNSWLGGLPTGILPILFYTLLPIYAAIPYATSYLEDKKSGYIRGMIAQYGRRAYYSNRFMMVFISGALVVLIPLLANMLLTACFIPFRMPDAIDNLYFQVYDDTIGGELFYTNPWAYDLLYLLLDAVFAGTWATVSLACSFFTDSKLLTIIVPYIGLIYLSYAGDLALKLRVWMNIQPLELIRPISVGNSENVWVLLSEIGILLLGALFVVYFRGKQDDVY